MKTRKPDQSDMPDFDNVDLTLQILRTIANDTGQWNGEGNSQYCDSAGNWLDVWILDTPPHAARAIVRRKDIDSAFVGYAYFRECVTSTAEWAKAPVTQLGKCALIASYRSAFPTLEEQMSPAPPPRKMQLVACSKR